MRLIVLDTETTGLDTNEGHKIIEIGCIEIINRKITDDTFHQYICPNHDIDDKAKEIHGISNEFLKDKPVFGDIVDDFLKYLSDSDLIIHNAPFDIGFLREELIHSNLDPDLIDKKRIVYDTLSLAREIAPGKRNSLDALCDRYNVDRASRDLHGALLDVRLLAGVYLKMTIGQTSITGLSLNSQKLRVDEVGLIENRKQRIIQADEKELTSHQDYFKE